MYTVVPALKTRWLGKLPALKTIVFSEPRCPAIPKIHGGVVISSHGPPKTRGNRHLCTQRTENRERSTAAAAAVCVGMNGFHSPAGASSAPGKKSHHAENLHAR